MKKLLIYISVAIFTLTIFAPKVFAAEFYYFGDTNFDGGATLQKCQASATQSGEDPRSCKQISGSGDFYFYPLIDSQSTTLQGCQKAETADFGVQNPTTCTDFTAVIVTPQQNPNPSTTPNSYNLLAPLGDITSIDAKTTVSQYLNVIFMIAIGICGGLAVVMIVIDGVTMMISESVFGKAEEKRKMMGAIGGLLLALGAYAIVNTLNPAFVNTTVTIPQVSIDIFTPTAGGGEEGVPNATKNITTYDYMLKTASSQTGVQCTLIKSFMYAESGGRNGLTSPGGAEGLLQLLPSTFTDQGFDVSKIMDPATNILAGAKFLNTLKVRGCNGASSSSVCNLSNIQFLAAAYNGGPKANGITTHCPNSTAWQCINNSGYAETRIYAPRVQANFNTLTSNGWGC